MYKFFICVIVFLSACSKKTTSPNEFRKAYADTIILDLEKNINNSIYYPDNNSRLDFEDTNIFVINDHGELFVGYVRAPVGPSVVYSMKDEKWRFEE